MADKRTDVARRRRARRSCESVSFTGPNSTTSRATDARNRPSEVPPLVDSAGVTPVTAADRVRQPRRPASRRRQERLRATTSTCRSYSSPCRSRIRVDALPQMRCAWRLGREAKIERTSSVPGTMFGAPVPAWMFEIWKVVGPKYSLPRSHVGAASSASAGAARWIGIAARARDTRYGTARP